MASQHIQFVGCHGFAMRRRYNAKAPIRISFFATWCSRWCSWDAAVQDGNERRSKVASELIEGFLPNDPGGPANGRKQMKNRASEPECYCWWRRNPFLPFLMRSLCVMLLQPLLPTLPLFCVDATAAVPAANVTAIESLQKHRQRS